jgi:hypothetical protein
MCALTGHIHVHVPMYRALVTSIAGTGGREVLRMEQWKYVKSSTESVRQSKSLPMVCASMCLVDVQLLTSVSTSKLSTSSDDRFQLLIA